MATFLPVTAVALSVIAELPAPPDGPVQEVDAHSTGLVEMPIWDGPAIDDGLFETLPSSLPDLQPASMPNPDLVTQVHGPPGLLQIRNLETGETEILQSSRRRSGLTGGQEGTNWSGLYGENPNSEDLYRTFTDLALVSNTSSFPESAACRLEVMYTDTDGDEHWYSCSGFMIDAETVITAGHCVYKHTDDSDDFTVNDFADRVIVHPGSHQGIDHWGGAEAFFVGAFTGWTEDENYDWDIGVICVNRAVGSLTGWSPWRWGDSCSDIQDRTYSNLSFPAEDCGEDDADGNPLHNAADMYFSGGEFDSCLGNQLQIDTTEGCFTAVWGGMSGSAYYYFNENNIRTVHAVVSNSNRTTFGRGAKIWESFSDYLLDTILPLALGSNFDLQALHLRSSVGVEEPPFLYAGDLVTNMRFTSTNPTNDSSSGTYSFDVYVSTDQVINENDTLIDQQSYEWNYSAMSTVNVNMSDFELPIGLPTGWYRGGPRI